MFDCGPGGTIGRFEILREIGRGGMGVVYEARDSESGAVVALKTLHDLSPAALYRFKREFRALADISHPNLVMLHELLCQRGRWLLTMELLCGNDWLSHVRGDSTASSRVSGLTGTTVAVGNGAPQRNRDRESAMPTWTEPDLGRLRDGLRGLAAGLGALHASGHLHQDVKSSNVMVTREGRVVLLDFGIVRDVSPRAGDETTSVVGTPGYMAPEQLTPGGAVEASDWYSVGVLLYQALTGHTPPVASVRANGQIEPPETPVSPGDCWSLAPPDLAQLCLELLSVEPSRRPGWRDIESLLGSESATPATQKSVAVDQRQPSILVGRDIELGALQRAFARAERGEATAVLVRGPSGIGKSYLVDYFLDELRGQGITVLAGRCHPRESVPFKALDSLIDALSRLLGRWPSHRVEAIMPRDAMELARLFPVLRRVRSIATARQRSARIADPLEQRLRAFAALRELLTRLSEAEPLVIYIDDLQWGDLDSVPVIESVLRPPAPPPLLFVGSYRLEDEGPAVHLAALADVLCDAEVIEVGPLDDEACRALVQQLQPAETATAELARESGGHPYFLRELVEFSRTQPPGVTAAATLTSLIAARSTGLAEGDMELLRCVALAGGPLARETAQRVANIADSQMPAAEQRLISARLLRLAETESQPRLECFHDTVRKVTLGALAAPDQIKLHRRLALALEAADTPDSEALAVHFAAADDVERAGRYAEQAADEATQSLAFDRAATLYRKALEQIGPQAAGRATLHGKLARALGNSGRGADAARAYGIAASCSEAETATALRQREAMHWLQSGYVDDGMKALRLVLAEIDVSLPTSRLRSGASALWRRLRVRLRLRGFDSDDVASTSCSAVDRRSLDIYWTAASGLSMVDPILGADFQGRFLLRALDVGDSVRIARGLTLEMAYAGIAGQGARGRCAELERAIRAIPAALEDDYTMAFFELARSIVFFLRGEWRECSAAAAHAEAVFRETSVGVSWEIHTASAFGLWATAYAGEFGDLLRRFPQMWSEAKERGNLYAMNQLATTLRPAITLLRGDADIAMTELDDAKKFLAPGIFQLQHLNAVVGETQILLYAGKGHEAHRVLETAWPKLRKSLLLNVQQTRIVLYQLRGASALAAMDGEVSAAERRRLIARARRCMRRISAEKAPWAEAMAASVEAGMLVGTGQRVAACAAATRSAELFAQVDMKLYGAFATHYHGALLQGTEGARLLAKATAWMRAQGIMNPLHARRVCFPVPVS